MVINLTNSVFSRHWFKAAYLFKVWSTLDSKRAFKACTMFDNSKSRKSILQHLSRVKKLYKKSKYYESRVARNISIRKTINKCIETFSFNKRHIIKSVLEWPFRKVVLDHLIVNNELILEPRKVMSAVDSIMEGWTRKQIAPISMFVHWSNQYAPLDYISNTAFSNVMDVIELAEFLLVVKKLSDGKAAGIFGIPNELWKHEDTQILGGLLNILNVCLELVLVETAKKILSKVLSDRISLACSKFNVFYDDNFSVLKGTFTQTLIFTIGSIIKNAFEKSKELWLIKICPHFIEFFGNIHNGRTNWIMTDFELIDGYTVYDGLDQGEVKKHKKLYGYRLNLKFFTRTSRADLKGGKTSFFAAGAFVDNTIWIGNCLVTTQYILNIASKFFLINNIAINTNKMITILINQEARGVSLFISGSEISIAKKGIFFSIDGLSKPSLAKVYSDIRFFSNVVLRKVITKKQFLYLVSAVLQLIIGYRLQFSCVSKGVCKKWDKILKKGLKLKANLPKDFSNKALYYLELYGLKTFEQVLTENLLAGLIKFANADRILSELFKHRAMELQTIGWMSRHFLKFSSKLLVDSTNCFLADTTCALKLCNLSLDSNLLNVFQARNNIAVLDVLGFKSYLGIVKSLKRYDVVFMNQLLDHHSKCFMWNTDPVPVWFAFLVKFIIEDGLLNGVLLSPHSIPTDFSCNFGYVGKHLLNSRLGFITVYTNSSIKNLGLVQAYGGAATYFLDVDTSVGIKINGLLSSTLVELQTIALALEYSQASLDLCKSAGNMAGSDFCDKCWIKKEHICYHSDVIRNERANFYVDAAVTSEFFLSLVVPYHFLNVKDRFVFRNACHVAKKLFNTTRCVGSVISVGLSDHFDKARTFCVWHPNGRIRSGYTSAVSAAFWSYFMKVLYYCLPMAKKKMYNLNYPNITCIWCDLMEDFDHVFSCSFDINTASSIDLFMALVKDFVLKSWVVDMLGCLGANSGGGALVVNFICCFVESYRFAIWLPMTKLKAYYEKYNLLPCNGSSIPSVSGLSSLWFAGTIWNFGFRPSSYVCFGLYLCLIRSDFGFLCDVPVVKNLGV
ncbi:hypothetical protein G9A89_014644 [Geosiphon pyriformis]|nr:hypothetical protein G9A89_014644 [Geosiphon pyriformis]